MSYKINFTLLVVAVMAMIVSCSTPKGETVETKDAEEVKETASYAVSYEVQTDQSSIGWVGSKPTGKHTGMIPVSEGSFSVTNGDLTGGAFTIDIKGLEVTDLEKDSDSYNKLKGHLMSKDFFAADSFATAKFEITDVQLFVEGSVTDKEEFKTDFAPKTATQNMVDNPTHTISGNLTMRGVTKNISFPASVTMTDTGISANAKFNIDRTDWSLSYGDEASAVDKAKDKFIYNTVNLELTVAASKAVM